MSFVYGTDAQLTFYFALIYSYFMNIILIYKNPIVEGNMFLYFTLGHIKMIYLKKENLKIDFPLKFCHAVRH